MQYTRIRNFVVQANGTPLAVRWSVSELNFNSAEILTDFNFMQFISEITVLFIRHLCIC